MSPFKGPGWVSAPIDVWLETPKPTLLASWAADGHRVEQVAELCGPLLRWTGAVGVGRCLPPLRHSVRVVEAVIHEMQRAFDKRTHPRSS